MWSWWRWEISTASRSAAESRAGAGALAAQVGRAATRSTGSVSSRDAVELEQHRGVADVGDAICLRIGPHRRIS